MSPLNIVILLTCVTVYKLNVSNWQKTSVNREKKEFASVFKISIDFLCPFSFFVNTTFNHIFLSNKFDWKFYFKRIETLRKKTYFRCVRKILTEPHILPCAKKTTFFGEVVARKKRQRKQNRMTTFLDTKLIDSPVEDDCAVLLIHWNELRLSLSGESCPTFTFSGGGCNTAAPGGCMWLYSDEQ